MSLRAGCAAVALVMLLAPTPFTATTGQVAAEPGVAVSEHSVKTLGCVTRREFRRVHMDMRKRRVHGIFDTTGKLFGEYGDGDFARWYKQCRPDPGYTKCRALVDYRVGNQGAARVASKQWSFYCQS